MLVKAKCTEKSWDSKACEFYYPGFEYEIERDSELANLKVGKNYVFEFDRNANPDDKPHDYSCKKCGESFDTLAELGRHSNATHKNDALMTDDEPAVIVPDGRGRKKGRTFTCKYPGCGEVLPNLYAMGQHNKTHVKVAETETVAA